MTLVLALDTSGAVGSVAVLSGTPDDAELLASEVLDEGLRRGVDLFPALRRILGTAGRTPRDVDLIAVGTGPGSYTGLRLGITAARGLAYATGAALLGIPSCDVWAAAVPDGDTPVAVVTDARVRAVYLSLHDSVPGGAPARSADPEILAPTEARARLPEHVRVTGDARAAYVAELGDLPWLDAPVRADAAVLAGLALRRHAAGAPGDPDAVTPLYLRKTEAERKWERLHG